jgi:abequosyltransferase
VTRPLLTVCIPAYNRASELGPLLDSIVTQDFRDWDVVISEDASRERDAIRAVAERYAEQHPGRIHYHENARTLGYDGNFRRLVELASGEFVFIMGNDDLVCPGAFAAVASAIGRYPDVGVILRAFAVFRGSPSNIVQVTRYYGGECSFAPGLPAFIACYRRIVAMSGLVLHRDSAHAVATTRWDGTLFYQHWLAANILCERRAVYVPDLLALFRKDGVPEFGNAESERGLYTPGVQPPDTDLRMLGSLLAIADDVGKAHGLPFAEKFKRDYAHYMYPTIAHQAHQPWRVLWRFYRDLGALGFDRYISFHMWFWVVALFGAERVDRMIQRIRQRVGHTPNLTRAARPTTMPLQEG